MSGGSFNYLYAQDETIELHEVRRMRAALLHLQGQLPEEWRFLLDDAIEDCGRLLIRPTDRTIAVWRAMEWWYSMESSAHSVIAAAITGQQYNVQAQLVSEMLLGFAGLVRGEEIPE